MHRLDHDQGVLDIAEYERLVMRESRGPGSADHLFGADSANAWRPVVS
jgi:hypothetical protein